MPRQKKTAEQRATEALETAERVYATAKKKTMTAVQELETAKVTEATTEARLRYVAAHPDLPENVREKYATAFATADGAGLTKSEPEPETNPEDGTHPPT